MEDAEDIAIKKLTALLPELVNVKTEIVQIQEKLSQIKYYKDFKINIDAPSTIPIQEAEVFAKFITNFQKTILDFKKSFNENELPEELRGIFLSIFLLVCKKGLVVDEDQIVYFDKSPGLWKKSTAYVLEKWNDLPYKAKAGYSLQAYGYLVSYYDLIRDINELESQLNNRH